MERLFTLSSVIFMQKQGAPESDFDFDPRKSPALPRALLASRHTLQFSNFVQPHQRCLNTRDSDHENDSENYVLCQRTKQKLFEDILCSIGGMAKASGGNAGLMERAENENAVFRPFHRPWKSLRKSRRIEFCFATRGTRCPNRPGKNMFIAALRITALARWITG